MKHGSLFSGIGGFDLAAEWMGWENVFHCEYNEFGRKILNYYWPESISYNDIKETDFTRHSGQIDILTGGFPCQPYSTSGKRKGKQDDRHLWPEMLRAISEIKPRWIVGENVTGIIGWNEGLVFEEVQFEMEDQGYETAAFILPACAVGAPHRRDRVWFVSRLITNSCSYGCNRYKEFKEGCENKPIRLSLNEFDAFSSTKSTANSNCFGSERWKKRHKPKTREKSIEKQIKRYNQFLAKGWEKFPTQSPVFSGNDGIPCELDGITVSKWKKESIKAYGNAIVPQVAHQIFKAIQEFDECQKKKSQ